MIHSAFNWIRHIEEKSLAPILSVYIIFVRNYRNNYIIIKYNHINIDQNIYS